ncbi:MAG: Zn-dependent hydrolase [Proteobacteria bacterium]|nr:MAG: Zn-dependent hydrolase [Pseudomonadota bacterium]
MKNSLVSLSLMLLLMACQTQTETDQTEAQEPSTITAIENHEVAYQHDPKPEDSKNQPPKSVGEQLLANYATFTLTADLSGLNNNQKKMLNHLIDAAKIMDDLFWQQSYGDKQKLLDSIEDSALKRYAEINYGPWDRLAGDEPFLEGYGEKPLGARFYPPEMTKDQFNEQANDDLRSLYTLVRTDDRGQLQAIPYHVAFQKPLQQAAELLNQAAELAEDQDFKKYLQLRAQALLNDDYQASDMAWLDMKNNVVDVVIGPIETYEDQLFGYKAAYEAFVLIKDQVWSQKLAKYAQFLPQLQAELPVPDKYKQETPGTDSDLNAYDALYYAGDTNAGSKTIAINLPNDEQVQLAKGTRRLQLKNSMHAKFEKILLPIAHELVVPEQRKHITFDAFFANTMFHEVAHGLGIKNTINKQGTVREALKEYAGAVEEGKADILGLYMVEKLHRMGELEGGELMDYYTTFMAGIFRSVRFGSSSAHGVANLLRFNYFAEQGAFNYNENSGHYAVNPEKMSTAIAALSEKILSLQGDGDYQAVADWFKQDGKQSPQLKKALATINEAGIPVDIVFQQGQAYLQ